MFDKVPQLDTTNTDNHGHNAWSQMEMEIEMEMENTRPTIMNSKRGRSSDWVAVLSLILAVLLLSSGPPYPRFDLPPSLSVRGDEMVVCPTREDRWV